MMKKYIIVIVMILAALLVPPSASTSKKILIDLSHDERILEDPYKCIGFEMPPCFEIYEEYEIIPSDKGILYKNLQDYDILIIGTPQESFTPSEIDTIARFVENGGGLLLAGESPGDCRRAESEYINSVSRTFGVEFNDIEAYKPEISGKMTLEVQIKAHPILQGISRLSLWAAGTLTLIDSSKALLHTGENCILACHEYGKGRVVFLSDSDFFLCPVASEEDNKQFVSNIFDWLSEPGGPHLHRQRSLEKGITLIERGEEQMELGDFAAAKSSLMQSKHNLEEEFYTYESDDVMNLIDRVDSLLDRIEIQAEAETLFQQGLVYFDERSYEDAIEQFEKCMLLYGEIDDTEKIQEISELIGKSEKALNAEDLFSEGVQYFEQQEYESAEQKFNEARAIYVELGDEEKKEECEEWISTCEEEKPEPVEEKPEEPKDGFCLGTVHLLFFVLIGNAFVHRNRKTLED